MNSRSAKLANRQLESFRFAETQGVITGYIAPPRASTAYDLAKARRLLQAALPQLAIEEWTVRIDMGDGKPLLVRAEGGTAAIAPDATDAEVACTLTTTPRVLISVLRRENLPRRALTRNDILVEGDTRLATRFCDALGGRRIVSNRVATSNPLPSPTTDLELARDQFDEFGYAIIKDALPPEQLHRIHRRLMEQAAAEREHGIACMQSGEADSPIQPNQRVWNLYNKGDEFLELLDHPLIDAIVPDVLGDYFLLSNFTANITGPGGKPMFPHTDQTHVAIDYPACMNIVWFLEDVTPENGGTRVLPGSHRPDIGLEDLYSIEEMTAVQGPAGSAFIFDARLWHATGPNLTKAGHRPIIIMLFGRFWERQIDNMVVSVSDETLAKLDERQRTMIGLRVTSTRGSIEGQPFGCDGAIIDRRHEGIGRLTPTHSAANQS